MIRRSAIAVFLFSTISVQAQGLNELNQRLGFCDAQTVVVKRATCFEKLAREALKIMEKRDAMSAVPVVQHDKTNPHAEFIATAKQNVIRNFKDPTTVQWRGLFVSGHALKVLCGELNGKNSYGAYVGFRRFYSTENQYQQDIEDTENPVRIERVWTSMCGDKVAEIDASGLVHPYIVPEEPKKPATQNQTLLIKRYENAEKAAATLKAATDGNVSLEQYNQYVRQLETEVDAVRSAAHGNNEESALYNFGQAIQAYKDASMFWRAYTNHFSHGGNKESDFGGLPIGMTGMQWFVDKYNVPMGQPDATGFQPGVTKALGLAKAWEYANAYIANARLDLLKPDD